jgi:ABC-type glycerol-3-phosphate transport system substrate-binding protein
MIGANKAKLAKQNLGRTSVIAIIRVAALAAALGFFAAGASAADAPAPDGCYASAKAEGALAFYVGGPTAPWEARAKAFEERYPGITI